MLKYVIQILENQRDNEKNLHFISLSISIYSEYFSYYTLLCIPW